MSGSTRSTIAASGRHTAAASSASSPVLPGPPRSRRRAGSRAARGGSAARRRRPGLGRLGVTSGSPARARLRSSASSIGSETTKLVPWPGSDSTEIVPPLASTNPLAMASPRPDPVSRPSPGRAPVEGLEDPLALGGAMPGPCRPRGRPRAGRRGGHAPTPAAARVAQGVLEQVGERPLELGGVHPHGGTSGSTVRRTSARGSAAPRWPRARHPRSTPSPGGARPDRPAAAKVEQLVDQLGQALPSSTTAALSSARSSGVSDRCRARGRRRRSRSAGCAGRARPPAAARS